MSEKLTIDIKAQDNTRGAFNSAQKNINNLNRAGKRLNTNMGGLQSTLLKVGAALGGFAVIKGIVNTIRTFQDLRATLVTIEGSTEKAAKSFEMLRKFTAKTTFQLDEVSNAFITLRNAGLNPTEEQMKNLGNIAAGMGKRLDDVARAVFNATTGEFEMLKQLGIKVKTESDSLKVSFRGITKTIEKDSASIVGFLEQVGRVDFAGAIEARSATLTGAISNMKDAIAEVAVAIGEGGFAGALTAIALDMKDFAMNSKEAAKQLGQALGTAVRATAAIFKALVNNLDLVVTAFGTLIAFKMAVAFANITTAIMGMNAAMITFNATTKRNIIFGAIAVFTGALGLLISKFKEFKGELKQVEYTGDLNTDLSMTNEELTMINKQLDEMIKKDPKLKNITSKSDIGTQIDPNLLFPGVVDLRETLIEEEVLYLELYNKKQAMEEAYRMLLAKKREEESKAIQEHIKTTIQQNDEKLQKQAEANQKAFTGLKESLMSETETIDNEKQKQLKILEEYHKTELALIESSDKDEKIKLVNKRQLYKRIEDQKIRILLEAVNKRMQIVEKAVNDDLAKQMEAATLFADILNDSTRKLELEYDNRQRIIENSYRDGYLTAVQYAKLTEALEKKKLKAIAEAEKEARISTIQSELEASGQKTDTARREAELKELYERDKTAYFKKQGEEALANMAKVNKKAFEAYKAYQIGQALIATYSAASKALTFPPGPPISFIYVAGAIAAGMAQVNAIRSQTYTGRRFGGPVREGETYMVGEQGPELFTPDQNGNIIPNHKLGNLNNQPTAGINPMLLNGMIDSLSDFQPRRFGGPVREGESYLVGEQGPELFSPSQNGNIIPNDNLGGQQVVVNFRVEAIDSGSFQGALAEQRDAIVSIVNEAVNDGGRRSITA